MYVRWTVNMYLTPLTKWFLCSSLPYFLCCVICCVVLSFAMIINLLVWADARNTCRQQGDGDSAAKSAWTSLYFRMSLSRAATHVIVRLYIYVPWLSYLLVFSWAPWCAMDCMESSLRLPDCAFMLSSRNIPFNLVY